MNNIKLPSTETKWAVCPYCGAKTVIYDNTANCSGVHQKCTRGCRRVFELVIKNGRQILSFNK